LRNLPLKSQIVLAPAVTIVLIMGLIGFTLAKLLDIKQQNESVREWVLVCTQAQGAITASQRMDDLAGQMRAGTLDADDELHFSYLEHSRMLQDHFRAAEFASRLPADTHAQIDAQVQAVLYRDNLDPAAVQSALDELLPELETINRNFNVQKRAAYTDYYDNVNNITSQLVSVSLWVLAVSVFTGIALSVWTIQRTKGRLGALARDARQICSGNLVSPAAPAEVRDEVDELAACMSTMTQRLLNVVASEKVLEGAEDERRRIAMDLHDQTLSDLTHLARELERLRSSRSSDGEWDSGVDGLQQDVDDIANNMRRLIDDLHPQSLDLLGLAKALRSYMEKRCSGPGMPEYFLHVDDGIDRNLTDFQRLSLYRIVLNLVGNIIRHARSTRFEIDLRREGNALTLIVEDNGIGFDYAEARHNGGHGLTNIEERSKAIGARFAWGGSRFSSGTRFELHLDANRAQQ